MMIVYTACPCCDGEDIKKVLSAKDHTVSNEIFDIWHCNRCTARFTQNIPDATEIGKYYQSENYISHSETKKGLINSLYHLVRKKTLDDKKDLLKRYTKLSTGKVLDIGAGTGAFLHCMMQHNWEVTGIEPDATARENAKKFYGVNLLSDEELFSGTLQNFDAITLWHVLEHVHDLHKYLGYLKKILKPGGCLFIAVPNYTSYDAGVYKEFWAAYDVPRHLYHFSPASFAKLVVKHGLQLKKIKPMWYDSFYVSMLSEKYKTGKNNFINAACNGFVSNVKTLFDNKKCSSVIYIITH